MNGLHPTFDALSAHSDRSDVAGARTRVGRHMARCARCRDVVSDIRGLGDAARAMKVPAAPTGLWARIEGAAGERRPAEPELPSGRERSTPWRRRRALAGLAAGAIAAAIVAVVIWPRPSGLQATGTSRLTFSPPRPVPGGTVRVRYQPAAWMKDAPRLVLVGRFARPAGSNPNRFGVSVFDELADSLGVLTPGADGAFVATLQLRPDFLAVRLAVVDPVRDELDVDGATPWIIIGGTSERAPSFASFLAAQDVRSGWYGGDERARPRQAVDVADSLKRHFPRHPAGWAFSRSYGVSKGKFDILRFFQSAERKYASMHDELWPQRGLDAERLHDMVVFANNIGEPDEVLRWSARLVEEHPEDPRALSDLTGALHEIELRMPPALGDTIRKWMPGLDRAYRAGRVPNEGFGEALRLATSYGDSSARALWRDRSSPYSVSGNIWMLTRGSKYASRDSVERELRARVERGCARPSGRYPLAQPVGDWQRQCERHRSLAYRYLSTQSRREGRTRLALLEADSAIVAMRRGVFCGFLGGYLEHALASLALGDTATAETDFALSSTAYQAGTERVMDTVRVYLGARFDQARYLARADSAHRAVNACIATVRDRTKERERRLGS